MRVTREELLRLTELVKGIHDVDEATARLGSPDSEIPAGLIMHGGPEISAYTTLHWNGHSDTASIVLTDYHPLGVRFSFMAKSKPKQD
jgi:hypothetical protein